MLERRHLHRIDHPRVPVRNRCELRLPLDLRPWDVAIAIDDEVRVDDGQAEQLAEGARERRLPRAAAADDGYAARMCAAR
jgi:hypothetical protein